MLASSLGDMTAVAMVAEMVDEMVVDLAATTDLLMDSVTVLHMDIYSVD